VDDPWAFPTQTSIHEKGEDVSRLFEESMIKGMELRNRFVRSATDEAMAGPKGEITDPLIKGGGPQKLDNVISSKSA
jgi:hypothetical protein